MPDSASRPPSDDGPRSHDFSLVLGGPLFQLLRVARLSDDALGLLRRRIVSAVLIMWVPLLVLSSLQGGVIGPGRRVLFLDDIGLQLRFLVVAPLLIYAELEVHERLRPLVDEFQVRNLVKPHHAARFAEAVSKATRLRNSVAAELLLLAFVYVAGEYFTFHRYRTTGAGAWHAIASGAGQLSFAGLWLVLVSLPLLQFLLLRWYFRLFIWAQFLWRVSKLDLDLSVNHPDKAGGLGFLADSLIAFVPIAMAHGVLFAGAIADAVLRRGATLVEFEVEIIAGLVFLIAVFAGPLMVFGPLLARVKRDGLREYGALGQTYVRGFSDKWLAGAPCEEPLVGSGDIQSLADLGNSYGVAEQMRIAPIRPSVLIYFVLAFLAPIAPLVLTLMSPEKLIGQLIGIIL
jgi:hypothetical protein